MGVEQWRVMTAEQRAVYNAKRKRRDYDRATGNPRMITGPAVRQVQAKIRGFRERGMSVRQIADLTGLTTATINDQASGAYRSAHRDTFRALAALEFQEPAPWARISPVGTQRRVLSMWRDGFGPSFQHEQTGWVDSQIRRVARGKSTYVQYRWARAVSDLYDRVREKTPEDFGTETWSARRIGGFAERMGGVPRYCWEEWTIDDPDAIPDWTGYCGTGFGMMVHRRDGIPVCRPCKEAYDPQHPYPGFNPDKLRKARERSGLTMKALEGLSGVSDKTVVTWESGRFTPGPRGTLDRVLQALDLTYEDVCDPVEGT